MKISMSATIGILAAALLAIGVAQAQPRLTVISQWSAGAEGEAMEAYGALVAKAGAKWEHSPVSGFTTDMMNKLRADIIAGRPPSASQLKGPEIKAWSAIGGTVPVDDLIAAAGYEKLISAELAKIHKPNGKWIAIPMQVHRLNNLYASKKALDKIGATALPKTWDEFNAMAAKMAAAGITPVAHGGLPWTDTLYFELVLLGYSPDAFRKALMELDDRALNGPEVLSALRQLRQMTTWMSPAAAGQHWSVFAPGLMKGDFGFLMMGGWASGVLKRGKFVEGVDYLCGMAPSNDGKPSFDLNADSLIFWDTKNADLLAGQKIAANVAMGQEFNKIFSQINGSLPPRIDISLNGPDFQDCQRDAAANLKAAVEQNRVVVSLSQNMAQTAPVTAALRDVVSEFVHDKRITPEQAQKRLSDAAASVR